MMLVLFALLVADAPDGRDVPPLKVEEDLREMARRDWAPALKKIEDSVAGGVSGVISYALFNRPFLKDASGEYSKDDKGKYMVDLSLTKRDFTKTMAFDLEFAHSGSNNRESRRVVDSRFSEPMDVTIVETKQQRFSLRKPASESRFSITDLRTAAEHVQSETPRFRYWDCISSGFAIRGYPIRRLMEDPTFRLVEVSRIRYESKDCLRVDFTLGGIGIPKPYIKVQSGSMIVCPSQSWALQEATCGAAGRPSDYIHVTVRYAPEALSAYVPSSVVYEVHNFNGHDSRTEFVVKRCSQSRVAPEQFTLAHYGLDSLGKPVRRRGWYNWPAALAICSVVALALSIALKRMASSRELSKTS